MKLSEYRPKLIQWLEQQVAIDSYLLDTPEAPGQTVAHLAPLRDLAYALEDTAQVSLKATQDLFIVRSYSGDTAYQNLDWATLYGLYQTLAIRLVHNYKDINEEFLDLTLEPQPAPIQVIEDATERRAWTLQLHWAFTFTTFAEPEVGQVQEPFLVTRINGGLYRTWLPSKDFSDKRLDWSGVFLTNR